MVPKLKISNKSQSIFSGFITRGRHKKIIKLKKSILRIDSALKSKCINDTDPITMEPLSECATIFSVVTEAGHKYSFDAKNLLNYVLISGKVQNPITRDPLNNIETQRLAKLCNYNGTLDAHNNQNPDSNDTFGSVIFGELSHLIDKLIDFCGSENSEEFIAKKVIESINNVEEIYNLLLDCIGPAPANLRIAILLTRIRLLIKNNNLAYFNIKGLLILEHIFSKTILSLTEIWTRARSPRTRRP